MSSSETVDSPEAGNALARRNTLVLAIAQALYGSGTIIIFTLGALAGQMLATNKALATLPITSFVMGTMISTFPASLHMRRVGRRIGFQTGAAFGLTGTLLAAWAIITGSFWLFCAAMMLTGGYQAFSQFYRFAAADTASEAFRPKAISLVLAGGIIAAITGPWIAIHSKDLLAPINFAGAFLAAAGLALTNMLSLSFLSIPLIRDEHAHLTPRSLPEIVRQPRFLVAVFSAMVSYAVMNFVMTATPLAVVGCGLEVSDAAFVIQWHVLAMFGPSFFTGSLINRFGVERVISAGLLLLAGCGLVALTGVEIERFWFALVLLGLGWNFGFVGATTMVTSCYRPEERAKAQGINDLMVFGSVATASLTSGLIYQLLGWNSVNMTIFPFVGAALILLAWLVRHERKMAPGS